MSEVGKSLASIDIHDPAGSALNAAKLVILADKIGDKVSVGHDKQPTAPEVSGGIESWVDALPLAC